MTINITAVATFNSPVRSVATGDGATQANFLFGMQDLANRTAWLASQVGGSQSRAASSGVQLLRHTTDLTALVAIATDLNTGEIIRVDGIGIYHYDAASTATVSSPSVLAPTSVGAGAGRWILDAVAAPTGTGVATTTSGVLDSAATGYGDLTKTSGVLRVTSLAAAAAIAVATALTFGATPASTGFIRAANNTTVVTARDNTTHDIPLLGTDASNNVHLGDSTAAQGALTVINGKTGISLKAAGTQIGSLSGSNTDTLLLGASATIAKIAANDIRFYVGPSSQTVFLKISDGGVGWCQFDVNNGLVINSTGYTNSIGTAGAWNINSGVNATNQLQIVMNSCGLALGGVCQALGSATNTILLLDGTSPSAAPTTGSAIYSTSGSLGLHTLGVVINKAVSAPKFSQADNTTNSATATSLTIQSQNATGTAATGGDLILTSGTGTTAAGSTRLQVGGVDIATMNALQFIIKKGIAYGGLSSKSSNYTLTNADAILVTSTSGIIFQVPPSPVVGQKHTFITQFTNGTSNIKINPNGATMFQGTNSVTTTTTISVTTAFLGVYSIMWDGAAWNLSTGW